MTGRFVKSLNAFKSGSSFLISSLTGKPSVSGLPVNISFELTNYCNLKCPECPTGSGLMRREKGFMDVRLFERTVNELGHYIYYINLFFQGEPMMHPDFFYFLNHQVIARKVVSTNGHFLGPENSEKLANSDLYKLIVSLDGMSQEAYSKYRLNGSLEQVIEGIRNVASSRERLNSGMKLELQFLVNRYNQYQIAEAKCFAREVRASLKLKSMQVTNFHDAGQWLPELKIYRRYEKAGDSYYIRNRFPDRCLRLWMNPVITWDGQVLPCCFDKDGEFVMGDLKKDSFIKIWNGPEYMEFRKQLLNDRKSIGICRNCTSGMRGVRI